MREKRTLRVFVDGSWLRDQKDDSHKAGRALESGGGHENNILRLSLPTDSSGRFGLQFAGLGSYVRAIRILNLHTMDFDLDWRDVEVK
jgi:hypothetical protein